MPVVINDFEVVSEAAPAQANAPQGKSDKPAKKLEPAQLEAPLAQLHEQHLRVWVH